MDETPPPQPPPQDASEAPAQAPGQTPAQTPAQSLDLCGLKCPLPVLKARRAIKDMVAGDRLQILADDPAASLDFAHFCETTGHHLIASEITPDGILRFIIEVADPANPAKSASSVNSTDPTDSAPPASSPNPTSKR